MYIKSSICIIKLYTNSFVNYSTIKLEKWDNGSSLSMDDGYFYALSGYENR